jgi:osmotically inducible protein OsmC
MRAKGSRAFGTFAVTHDITRYTRAKELHEGRRGVRRRDRPGARHPHHRGRAIARLQTHQTGGAMKRTANATWSGGLKEGRGTFSVQSGAVNDLKYSFRTRFEDTPGTNPEELIAAAHASCFSMALSAQLGERGITPEIIETRCIVTFENLTLTKSVLQTAVTARGADRASMEAAAAAAKAGCPISKVLKLEIALELTVHV